MCSVLRLLLTWPILYGKNLFHVCHHDTSLKQKCFASFLQMFQRKTFAKHFYRWLHVKQNRVNGGDTVFVWCASVCLSVRSGPVNQTSLKWLKLRLQISHAYSQGQSRHDSLKIFPKGCVVRVTWPLNFGALNAYSFKTVKATDLKFDMHVSRVSLDMTHWKFFE